MKENYLTFKYAHKANAQFTFNNNYPIESPEVIFVGDVPVHEHIYSNGHICISILYDQWSPALTVSSVCLSILSMLSSSKQKVYIHAKQCRKDRKTTTLISRAAMVDLPKRLRGFITVKYCLMPR